MPLNIPTVAMEITPVKRMHANAECIARCMNGGRGGGGWRGAVHESSRHVDSWSPAMDLEKKS